MLTPEEKAALIKLQEDGKWIDRELTVMDKMVSLMLHSNLCNGERWRICEYLNDRFGRPEPPKD